MLSKLLRKIRSLKTNTVLFLMGQMAMAGLVMFCLWISACGVKGDPLPPLKPVELGRGQPSYKKASEKIQLEKFPADEEEEEKLKKHEREDE